MRGATLTTTTTSGAILVALLALFVQLTGTHLWGISRFTIHQIRVSKNPRDGLYHQQQVILRNFSPADAATALMQVGWQWKSRIRNPARRSLPLALVPLAHSIVFLLAAILSATASSSQGNEVLVSSPYCGLINYGTPNLTAVVNILNSCETQSLSDSASYARSCYASEGTGRTWQDCSTFPVSRLPVIQTNTSCPFEADICTAPSIQLDTGLMDSDLSFGMNAPPSNRVKFRKVTSCAPIEVDQFSGVKEGSSQASNYTVTSALPELQYVELYYGPSTIIGTNGTYTRDYTYNHHTFLLNFTYENEDGFRDMFDYDFFATSFYPGSPQNSSDFVPVSQLNRNDADVTLAFLSANSIPFVSPVDDPWYSAHSNPFQAIINDSAFQDNAGGSAIGTAYFRDRPVSVLACTEQYQLCASNPSPECTPLTGIDLLLEAMGNFSGVQAAISLNSAQTATPEVLFIASASMDLGALIGLLDVSSLLARNSKYTSIQGSLPSNQWTLEVENWNQILLADMQRSVLEYATGPSNPEILPFLSPPNGSSQVNLCHNQRARSGQAQNFSVLAIVLILILGLLIICVDIGLHRFVGYAQREQDLKDYRRLAWKSNWLLQLQRLAHEAAGFGTWERCAKAVPITVQGEVLAVLDVNEPEHPVLLKIPVSPCQPIQPTSNPQTVNTTDPVALPSEAEPKPGVEVHETEHLSPSSSSNNAGDPSLSVTTQTRSIPNGQTPLPESRRHSL